VIVVTSPLTVAEAAKIMREAIKDKSYLAYPLGREWGEFLRAKRMARCRPNTIESYESVGDKFARYFADFETLSPFAITQTYLHSTVEDLRAALEGMEVS
jgi:hypothetical protein